jgi:prepilin-type N-terminal cleavage/methylation domain-containing protein
MPTLASTRLSSRSARSARGYTAIEVLIAMTVMAIGAAAVMSMQKASVQGNLDARKTDVANSIARMWVERLERDATQWTQPNTNNVLGNNLGIATALFRNLDNGWFVPVPPAATSPMTYAYDILGRDLLPADAGSAVFCVNMRLKTLVTGVPVQGGAPVPQLIRADVRVVWLRGLGVNPTGTFCDPGNADMGTSDLNETGRVGGPAYHAIYVTTAVKENPSQ